MKESVTVLLFGPPGSGKGTQAVFMKEKKGYFHISTGDLIRGAMEDKEFSKKVRAYSDRGELVPDDIILSLIEKVFEGLSETDCVVLDGFPRTLNQALALDELLSKKKRSLKEVFFLDVSLDILKERLSGRRSCPSCAAVYHISQFKRMKKKGFCDVCATFLVRRQDDRPQVIEKRFQVYRKIIAPLEDFYSKKGILRKIDGGGGPEHIFEQINSFLA